jgi:hypothetical protein
LKIAVLGSSLQDTSAFAQKIRQSLHRFRFCGICNCAGTLITRRWTSTLAGSVPDKFGLTMADVAHSVVPATSSSRFTQPNYWRDPNSGNAFQIKVELPQSRMQASTNPEIWL